MEDLEKILKFLKIKVLNLSYDSNYGAGIGCGSCSSYELGNFLGYDPGYESGDGSGIGSGNGSDDNCGYGLGIGSGNGSGYDLSYGSNYELGNFSGNDLGYGWSMGLGNGSGAGSFYSLKIKQIKEDLVYYVDETPTIFDHIHGNVAKGKIVNTDDFSLKECYIVKNEHYFAHGETLKQALADLEEKTFYHMPVEEKINEFRKKFNNKDKYSGNDFFTWHHILTGSCLAGRNSFVESGHYDLSKTYTVKEFIQICENAYGKRVIKRLKEYYH